MDVWEPWAVPRGGFAAALAPGEALVASQGGVGMYDGDTKVKDMQRGTAVVTTHRLAYVDDDAPERSRFVHLRLVHQTEHYKGFLRSSPKITVALRRKAHVGGWVCHVCGLDNAQTTSLERRCRQCGVQAESGPTAAVCPACTFQNAPETEQCAMCGTRLAPGDAGTVRMSFRQGGDRPFYTQLRATLQTGAWRTTQRPSAGIHGVVTNATALAAPKPDAFADLAQLMSQAKGMVSLAASLRTELERRERVLGREGTTASDEASSMIQSTLVQLGLAAPAVTPEMARSEQAYHKALAQELAQLLQGAHGRPGLLIADDTQGRGLVPMDEVWGVWNRMRGTGTWHDLPALVSPKVMRAAAAFLPEVTQPRVKMRVLRSGLTVLHTPQYDDEALEARILSYLDTPQSTWALAAREHVPWALLAELLQGLLLHSSALAVDVCGTQDRRWFRNTMLLPT